jgi:RimJ/RimL family protein N-acetyltransferase
MMLEGKLVRLRAVEPEDEPRDYTWVNDCEVTQFLSIRYPLSHADEERFVNDRPANDFSNVVLAIVTKDTATHIGNTGLHRGNPEDSKAELGIMIGDKDHWSRGYGQDAIETLLRFGFHEMNLHRIYLRVFDFNERAQACYRKCGFVEEGCLRDDRYQDGCYHDTVMMGILREEYDAMQKGRAP